MSSITAPPHFESYTSTRLQSVKNITTTTSSTIYPEEQINTHDAIQGENNSDKVKTRNTVRTNSLIYNMPSMFKGFELVFSIIGKTFSNKQEIDVLFQRYIDMDSNDQDLYETVKGVLSGWSLMITLWTTLCTPSIFTLPSYIDQTDQNVLSAYIILSSISILTSVSSLYIVVRNYFIIILYNILSK